ncbi:hypothetical protein [Saccharopolyspora sp. NPDC002376]
MHVIDCRGHVVEDVGAVQHGLHRALNEHDRAATAYGGGEKPSTIIYPQSKQTVLPRPIESARTSITRNSNSSRSNGVFLGLDVGKEGRWWPACRREQQLAISAASSGVQQVLPPMPDPALQHVDAAHELTGVHS